MPPERENTTIKVSMTTHVSLEALKEEYFTNSTSFNDIIAELADFYRKNKKNISDKIQFLESQLGALSNKVDGLSVLYQKNTEIMVNALSKVEGFEKRLQELEGVDGIAEKPNSKE